MTAGIRLSRGREEAKRKAEEAKRGHQAQAGTQDETKKRLANEREKLTGHFICGLQLRSGLQNVEALLLLAPTLL